MKHSLLRRLTIPAFLVTAGLRLARDERPRRNVYAGFAGGVRFAALYPDVDPSVLSRRNG